MARPIKIVAKSTQNITKVRQTFIRILRSNVDLIVRVNGVEYTAPAGWSYEDKNGFERVDIHNPSDTTAVIDVALAKNGGKVGYDATALDGSVKVRGGGISGDTVHINIGATAIKILDADMHRTSAVIKSGDSDLWIYKNNQGTATKIPTMSAGETMTIGHTGEVWAIRKDSTAPAMVYFERGE